jgi:Ankyrin repeats (many copies)
VVLRCGNVPVADTLLQVAATDCIAVLQVLGGQTSPYRSQHGFAWNAIKPPTPPATSHGDFPVDAQVETGAQDGRSASASRVSGDSLLSTGAGVDGDAAATITAAIKRKNSQLIATFLRAAADNAVESVAAMLESGKVSVDDTDDNRRTALHVAAARGHTDLCAALLKAHSATIDLRDRTGASPLDVALTARRAP